MQDQNFHRGQTEAQRDLLRFLSYRKEVISSWRASEEKRILLQTIQAKIDSFSPVCVGRMRRMTPHLL